MWIDYRERLSEGVEELARAERAVRGPAMAARVKLLRLLKAGEQRSLAGAAEGAVASFVIPYHLLLYVKLMAAHAQASRSSR